MTADMNVEEVVESIYSAMRQGEVRSLFESLGVELSQERLMPRERLVSPGEVVPFPTPDLLALLS